MRLGGVQPTSATSFVIGLLLPQCVGTLAMLAYLGSAILLGNKSSVDGFF